MWKYVLKVALRQKPRFFFFILMLFMSFSVSSISPYFNGIFIDMLCRPTSSRDVVALSLVIAGLGIVGAALSYFASMITSKLMTKTSMDLLRDEIGNLQISELLFIEKQNPAYLTQRLSQDVNSVSSFVLSNFMTVILNLARIALILFFLLYTSWFLGIFALILCGLYLLVFLLLKKPLYASLSQKKEAEAKMYGFMTTQVRNSFIIQLNSQYQQAQSELNHVFRISFPYILRAYKCSYLFSSADSIISVVFQTAFNIKDFLAVYEHLYEIFRNSNRFGSNDYIDFRLQPLMLLGRAKQNINIVPTDLQYRELVSYINTINSTNMHRPLINIKWGDPIDHLMRFKKEENFLDQISIHANGDIVVSAYLPLVVGNIRNHPLGEYWECGLSTVWSTDVVQYLVSKMQSIHDMLHITNKIADINMNDGLNIDLIDQDLNDFNLIRNVLLADI